MTDSQIYDKNYIGDLDFIVISKLNQCSFKRKKKNMKKQVVLTTDLFRKGYAFGVTKKVEKVFVPMRGRTTVAKKCPAPILNEDNTGAPKYYVKEGLTIFAHLAKGRDGRLVAELWAPLSVCKGEKPVVHKSKKKFSSSGKKTDKPKGKPQTQRKNSSGFKPAGGLSILLGELRSEYSERRIRVRPENGRGQIFYGHLGTLLEAKTKSTQEALSNASNVFEFLDDDGQSQKVWPFDDADALTVEAAAS